MSNGSSNLEFFMEEMSENEQRLCSAYAMQPFTDRPGVQLVKRAHRYDHASRIIVYKALRYHHIHNNNITTAISEMKFESSTDLISHLFHQFPVIYKHVLQRYAERPGDIFAILAACTDKTDASQAKTPLWGVFKKRKQGSKTYWEVHFPTASEVQQHRSVVGKNLRCRVKVSRLNSNLDSSQCSEQSDSQSQYSEDDYSVQSSPSGSPYPMYPLDSVAPASVYQQNINTTTFLPNTPVAQFYEFPYTQILAPSFPHHTNFVEQQPIPLPASTFDASTRDDMFAPAYLPTTGGMDDCQYLRLDDCLSPRTPSSFAFSTINPDYLNIGCGDCSMET